MTHTRTVITLVYFFLSAFRLNTVCFLRQSCCDFSGRVCLTPLPDNESQTTSAGAPFIRNVYCRSSFFFFQFFDNSFCSLVLKWKKHVSLSPHLPLMATGCRCTEGHPSSPSETLMWWIKKNTTTRRWPDFKNKPESHTIRWHDISKTESVAEILKNQMIS